MTFVETEHPRGQAANAGQFREKTNSAPAGALSGPAAEELPLCPTHGGEWGDDITCETCVDAGGEMRPTPPTDVDPHAEAEQRARERYAAIDRWGQNSLHVGSRTPWGNADNVTEIAPGFDIAGTPGHGGVKLSPARNALIPPALRNSSGWYEEDCEINIPIRYFPDEFITQPHLRDRYTAETMQASAEDSIKDWFPDKWEKANGRELEPGESREKDRQLWATVHEADFVVTSAINAASNPELVRVSARRASDGAVAEYLIPKDEYEARRDGDRARDGRFAVDPTRHAMLPAKPAVTKPEETVHRHALGDVHALRADATLTDAARNRILGDVNKLWNMRDGRNRTLREVVEEDGVHGLRAHNDGARMKYSVSLQGGYSIPVTKATWDYLSRGLPDTRPAWLAAQQDYSVANAKLEDFTGGGDYRFWRDPKAKARAAKLEAEATRLYTISQAAHARHDEERAATEPTAEQLKSALIAREQAAQVIA